MAQSQSGPSVGHRILHRPGDERADLPRPIGQKRPVGSGDPVRGQGRSCPDRLGKNAHLVKTTLFKTTNYNYADKARAEKRVWRGRGPSGGEPSLPCASQRPARGGDKRKGPCPKAGTLGKINHKEPVRTDYLPATSRMALDSLSTATSQSTPRMISGGKSEAKRS